MLQVKVLKYTRKLVLFDLCYGYGYSYGLIFVLNYDFEC